MTGSNLDSWRRRRSAGKVFFTKGTSFVIFYIYYTTKIFSRQVVAGLTWKSSPKTGRS